jgi:hypothetical protein
MEAIMQLVIDRQGNARCLYGEAINLAALGDLSIDRASHVEPDAAGQWWANLSPVAGPTLGPFERRSQALAAERIWLEQHLLDSPEQPFSLSPVSHR